MCVGVDTDRFWGPWYPVPLGETSFYRPQTKFAKVMFWQVSVCPQGGHAWLLPGGACMVALGGACVVARGVCMVALGVCVWLLPGGHAWLLGGACVVALGGHAWLLWGGAWLLGGMRGCSWGVGMHGCSRGACMVALGGHAWLLWGVHGCLGACVVASGGVGMCGCSGGACVVARGVCTVAGGCAWLLPGGACVVPRGGMRGFFHEIRSMSGRYASYWNAFLFCQEDCPPPTRL